jgi:hypothetical protein
MPESRPDDRRINLLFCALTLLIAVPAASGPADPQPRKAALFPAPEKLTYRIEWRLVTAGSATVQLTRAAQQRWQINLNLESAGLVSRLYRVLDTYRVVSDDAFCGVSSVFDAQEGRRHFATVSDFDNSRHKLSYDEKDLVKNTVAKHEVDIAPCTYEITGALSALREMRVDPGRTIALPMTNGKKLVNAKVEAQARENISIDGKNYSTVRYEAFVFDNVIYRRKGRLFIWMTDDAERMPVQLRIQAGFPIGNVTLELEKHEKL